MRRCSIEGCEKKHIAKGMCRRHYDAWKWRTDEKYREKTRERQRRCHKKKYANDEEYREKTKERNRLYFLKPEGKMARRREVARRRLKRNKRYDEKKAREAFKRITANMDEEEKEAFADKVRDICSCGWRPKVSK